ncbi:hypothetical protein EVAR_88369_1 [Eumeta japonica]|uniref:Uncharacterized protein n=1 Tax=Eumeta variegata TaxID=151549 RepID=A0A4C1XCH5_EUMVA|nr:hypothetical protein EVAR_88369_1 [Eumeta japonica]
MVRVIAVGTGGPAARAQLTEMRSPYPIDKSIPSRLYCDRVFLTPKAFILCDEFVDGCCARGRPIIVEWERDARHSAGLSLVRGVEMAVKTHVQGSIPDFGHCVFLRRTRKSVVPLNAFRIPTSGRNGFTSAGVQSAAAGASLVAVD